MSDNSLNTDSKRLNSFPDAQEALRRYSQTKEEIPSFLKRNTPSDLESTSNQASFNSNNPQSKPTSVNSNSVSKPTSVNINSTSKPTSVNRNSASKPTSLNNNQNERFDSSSEEEQMHTTARGWFTIGSMIGKYKVTDLISVEGGETQVYHCIYDNQEFAVKVYKNEVSLKQEVIDILSENLSPYVARMCEVGEVSIVINESKQYHTYVVEPIYKPISIPMTYKQLKKLIENMNEGLHALHTAKESIIHKDVKPANIMQDENGNYLLIDFGISSVLENGLTNVKTKTGLTFDYAAPESRSFNRFSPSTDYYSLGITLYQIFVGEYPYAELEDSVDRMEMLVRHGLQITDDSGIPENLALLLKGLTFYNSEPEINKQRWGYAEVKRWLEGDETLQLPVVEHREQKSGYDAASKVKTEMPPYNFKGAVYTERLVFMEALGENWEDGKKALGRGLLTNHFMTMGNQELVTYCMDAEDDIKDGKDPDGVYYEFLYRMEPRLDKIYWRGRAYTEDEFFLERWYRPLWNDNGKCDFSGSLKEILEILDRHLLSTFYRGNETINIEYFEELEAWKRVEGKEFLEKMYEVAVVSIGSYLFFDGRIFKTRKDLERYMNELLDKSYQAFSETCDRFYYLKERDVQFEIWLLNAN